MAAFPRRVALQRRPAAGGHSATVCGCPASRRRCRTERPGRRPSRRNSRRWPATPQAQPRHPRRRSTDPRRAPAQAGPPNRRSNASAGHRAAPAAAGGATGAPTAPRQRPELVQATERRSEAGPGGATPRRVVAAPGGLPARLFSGHALRCSRRYARDIRGGAEAPRRRGERPAGGPSPGTAPPGVSTKPRRGKRQPVRHGGGPCRSERQRTALSAASSSSEAFCVCPHRPPCPEPPVEPVGAHNSVVGADQGFRAPSGDQESVQDSVHEDSASAPIAARQRPRRSFRHPRVS